MLCNGKAAHKVDTSPNDAWYIFHFRVSDFTPKVQRKYKLVHNCDDVEVCLVRSPTTEGEYKIFVKGYALEIEKLVDMYDLEQPYRLATIIAGLLEKLQKVC
jgi:hypothetical protein